MPVDRLKQASLDIRHETAATTRSAPTRMTLPPRLTQRNLLGMVLPHSTPEARSTRRSASRAVKIAPSAPEDYDVTPKLNAAIHTLGNNTVADLLGVSRSQPGRWSRGEEGISPDNQVAILDLDYVLSLLFRAMAPSLAAVWLVSPNAHLNGARPVDAFRVAGQRPVTDAIHAHLQGAFA